MIESLVITLREGLEAALVIGIILAYINKMGRHELKKNVYYGLAAAVIASIVGAVVFSLVGIDPENELVEGSMYFVAGIFVATMVIWMWKTSRNLRSEMERKLDNIVKGDMPGVGTQGWGIFAFTFIMVFREGVETVLFLAALAGKTNPILSYLGSLAGLALTVVFAVYFIKGSLKINLQKFFKVTGIILLILVVRLIAGGFHEFGEAMLIPLNPTIMAILGFIVKDSTSQIISMMLLTLPIILVLLDVKSSAETSIKRDHTNSVEKRKYQAQVAMVRKWKYTVVAIAVVMNLILGADLVSAMTKPTFDPIPEPVTAVGGQIVIPAKDLKESILKKYVYDAGGVKIRFILIKRADGTIGTGLDACEICGPKGYFQNEDDKDNIICKNCNAPISIPTIGMPGGCNPVALEAQTAGGNIIVKTANLEKNKTVFSKKS